MTKPAGANGPVIVTTEDLVAMEACEPGLNWWAEHFPSGAAEFDDVVAALKNDRKFDYLCWLKEKYECDWYTFDELDDDGKSAAIEEVASDIDYSCLYDDFVRAGKMIGVEFDIRRGTRNEPCIFWSGFYHQGSGLGYEAVYRYAKGAPKAVSSEWPQDTELQGIATALQKAQRRNFYRLYARIESVRDISIRVRVEDGENPYRDIGDAEDEVEEALRDFATWMYLQLRDEYEYQTSEDCVRQQCLDNDYKFDRFGELL